MVMFDLLLDGWLELGFGVGWVVSEYEVMGLVMDDALTCIVCLVDMVLFMKVFFIGETFDIFGLYVIVKNYKG